MKKPASKKSPAKAKSVAKKSPRKNAPKTVVPVVEEKPANRLLQLLIQSLDAKKAEDLRVFNVSKHSSITDYLVLATVTAEPHLRALRIEMEKVLDAENAKILGIDTMAGSGWLVVDAFDVMVHLFTKESRNKYRLELLWRDARELDVRKLLGV
jgi:ribosome-associated protein